MDTKKAAELIANLTEMTKSQGLPWNRDAQGTGYITKVGDISIEIDKRDETGLMAAGVPTLYTFELRDSTGRLIDKYSEGGVRALSLGQMPEVALKTLYDFLYRTDPDQEIVDHLIAATRFSTK